MKQKFINQSEQVKKLLEVRFTKEQLAQNYIYQQLDKLVSEVETNLFTSNKTDIGQAAIKIYDSGITNDNELCTAICNLADMYHRIQF